MKTWRLLDTPPMTAAENMALDEALLELKGRGRSPDTIRFLQFKPRCVLVGYHQALQEEIRLDYCREQGIEVNRRITGGGAIFFDENQLGWEVYCDKSFFDVIIPNNRLFKTLCQPVAVALGRLGLKAEFRPRNDIEINGRKISGTGGTESGEAFMFQGTMLVDFDVQTMLRALRIPVEKLKAKEIDSVRERVTCLSWELGYTPKLAQIKAAIRYGFEHHLGIRLEPAGLTEEETRLFHAKLDRFRSSTWIDRVKPRFQKRETVQSAYKADAGMVRFTLVVNLPQRRIKDIYITGDFLSFPGRALYDLEAELRGMSLDRDQLLFKIRRWFEEGVRHPPGALQPDFGDQRHVR
ncbi:MAG: biotin/lipoate A/B protein ligase family protein [Desulfosarcinaceae bacterium]